MSFGLSSFVRRLESVSYKERSFRIEKIMKTSILQLRVGSRLKAGESYSKEQRKCESAIYLPLVLRSPRRSIS